MTLAPGRVRRGRAWRRRRGSGAASDPRIDSFVAPGDDRPADQHRARSLDTSVDRHHRRDTADVHAISPQDRPRARVGGTDWPRSRCCGREDPAPVGGWSGIQVPADASVFVLDRAPSDRGGARPRRRRSSHGGRRECGFWPARRHRHLEDSQSGAPEDGTADRARRRSRGASRRRRDLDGDPVRDRHAVEDAGAVVGSRVVDVKTLATDRLGTSADASPAGPTRGAAASRRRRGNARPLRPCRPRPHARGSRPRRTSRGCTSSPTRRPRSSAPRRPTAPLALPTAGRSRRRDRAAVLADRAEPDHAPPALGPRAEHVHELLGDLGEEPARRVVVGGAEEHAAPRVAEVETLSGPGDADVAEAALLLELSGSPRERKCGKTPSSRPVRNTTGNSSPFAVCSVIRVTALWSPPRRRRRCR